MIAPTTQPRAAEPHDGMVPAIACAGLGKGFDGVPVLRDVSVSFMAGTVNVLAGENGAGKSTLFKLVAGQLAPDRGTVALFGETVRRFDPKTAQAMGVSIIPQELAPIPEMRLWQNLLIGHETTGMLGLVRRRAMIAQAGAMLDSVGLDLDPTLPMKRLGLAATQMVEILKATSWDSRIVLMDEPSSSLSSRETEQLFRVIGLLRDRGTCILYTSHRMEEIEAISDTVAIMRDGAIIRHQATSALTERQIIADMVGREITELFPDRPMARPDAAPVLAVRDLRVQGAGNGNGSAVSFTLHAGEILGLGGLVGAGRSEMLEAIFGLRPATGHVTLDGAVLPLGRMGESIRRGIALVPEDRKLAGVLTSLSILDNVTLPHLDRFTGPGGWMDNQARRRGALDVLERLPDASLSRVYLLHPDPWPKARHAKRRMVNPGPLDLIAAKLKPGCEFRLGTDDPTYCRWATMVMDTRRDFVWTAGAPADFLPRPADWPETRYERKARRQGHEVWDFTYRRV